MDKFWDCRYCWLVKFFHSLSFARRVPRSLMYGWHMSPLCCFICSFTWLPSIAEVTKELPKVKRREGKKGGSAGRLAQTFCKIIPFVFSTNVKVLSYPAVWPTTNDYLGWASNLCKHLRILCHTCEKSNIIFKWNRSLGFWWSLFFGSIFLSTQFSGKQFFQKIKYLWTQSSITY